MHLWAHFREKLFLFRTLLRTPQKFTNKLTLQIFSQPRTAGHRTGIRQILLLCYDTQILLAIIQGIMVDMVDDSFVSHFQAHYLSVQQNSLRLMGQLSGPTISNCVH